MSETRERFATRITIVYEDAYQEVEDEDIHIQTYLAERNAAKAVYTAALRDYRSHIAKQVTGNHRMMTAPIEQFAASLGLDLDDAP